MATGWNGSVCPCRWCQLNLRLVIRQGEFDERLGGARRRRQQSLREREIGLVPTGGGIITFGSSHGFDAVF